MRHPWLLRTCVVLASTGVVGGCSSLLGDFAVGAAGDLDAGNPPSGGSDTGAADGFSPIDTGGPPAEDGGAPDTFVPPHDAAVDASDASDVYVPPPVCEQTSDDAGAAAVLIASGQGDPEGIAVDGTSVYWLNETSGTVVSCPLSGCPAGGPKLLASGQNSPFRIVVDSTSVYWVNIFASIQKCPLAGCGANAPTVYAPGSTKATGLAVDSTSIYWTELQNGLVASCPLAGCATKNVLYAGPDGPTYGVAIDPSNVYWANVTTTGIGRHGAARGRPRGRRRDGDRHRHGRHFVHRDRLDDDLLHERVRERHVTRAAGGGAGRRRGDRPLASNLPYLEDIVVDPLCHTVYFAARGIQQDGGDLLGTVYRCGISSCGAGPDPFAGNQNGPVGLAQDGQYVYWTNTYDGTVWKKHK